MANQKKTRTIKLSSYQSQVCARLLKLLLEYEDCNDEKIFEQFKGKFYNAKQTIPDSKFPAIFIYISSADRQPFGIRRQDLWNLTVKVQMYTLDHAENDMNQHYAWVQGLDRVCRENPHLFIDGDDDLSIQKADLETAAYDFASGDEFLVSETDATVMVQTKLCLANKIC